MKDITDIFIDFIEKYKRSLLFILEHFRDKDILKRKNQGLIEEKNPTLSLLNTNWSFFSYANNINPQITEEEAESHLIKKVRNNELEYDKKIFKLAKKYIKYGASDDELTVIKSIVEK